MMSDSVTKWLEELGLVDYASVFAENNIDWELLPELDHEILKEIGMASAGHRMRIMKAAGALRSESRDSGSPGEGARATTTPLPERSEAERRQLTVMFCDLVGSTELSQKLDPEDLREVNRAYQDISKVVIERYEGYVARYMGDGVLAYFGYPQAHEDDAERAVHAGLGLVENVAALNENVAKEKGVELTVRVGIATGPVVVGDLIGEGASQESAVVGETPNLAARLQGVATSNTVVIAPSTHSLTKGRFEYEDRGTHALKGIVEATSVWRVIRPTSTESRFDAVHRTGLTTFLGREQEIGLLLDRWQSAKEGEGQVVLLSGEAGVGKSRIVEEFRERLTGQKHTRLCNQCSPLRTNSSLYPLISQIEFAAGFASRDRVNQKLDKLEDLLGQSETVDGQTLALFASLLSLPTEDRYPPLDLSPQELKEQTLRALSDQFVRLATRQPVLYELEDAHWIDPTTLELIDLTVDEVQSLPVLMLITFRPEFDCPWASHAHTTTLALNRLTRSQSAVMVRQLSGGKAVPAEVLEQIVIKTDGVPLFIEELTKNVLESGLLTETDDRFELAGPLPPLAIPASLQDSLMARLDRLASIKDIAQIGAVIGREFSYELVSAVVGLGDAELRDALVRLTEVELIFRRGTPPKASYVFKHALVQDTAYSSLLKSRRQQLHGDIARTLVERFPALVETQPEVLARHYTEAGLAKQALDQWKEAAKRALGRSAYIEAVQHLDKGLSQLAKLPDDEHRDKHELELQVMKLGPLLPVRGYGAPELDKTSARALELCRRVGDAETLFPTLYSRWVIHYVKSEQEGVLELSREFLERARTDDLNAARIVGNRIHASAHLMRGDIPTARARAREALSLYVPDAHQPLVGRFGHDIGVASMAYVSITEALSGNVEDALTVAEEAIDYAQSLGHVNTRAYGLYHAGVWLPAIVRDLDRLERYAEELLELASTYRLAFWAAFVTPHLLAARGCSGGGVEPSAAEQALALYRNEFVGGLNVPEMLCGIAEMYLDVGRNDDARRILTDAREFMERTGQIYWQPELHRLQGKLALNSESNHEAACAQYREAMTCANDRGLMLLKLRAATEFARVLQFRGDFTEARQLLDPIYAQLPKGSQTSDFEDAQALLDQLS